MPSATRFRSITVFLGEREVKNIAKPVRAYQARLKPGATLPPPRLQKVAFERRKPEKSKRLVLAIPVAILAVIAITVLISTRPWRDREQVVDGTPTVVPTDGNPAIAVLPFENISDDPAQEFYADGMTGDLITDLSRLSGLAVIARHSVFAYKDKPAALDQIARELGVRYLLEGNMRRLEGKVRINVSLIDASNLRSIWSERYDIDQAELFGRKDCGHVYRNPRGTRDEQNEYVRVALGSIYYFSVR